MISKDASNIRKARTATTATAGTATAGTATKAGSEIKGTVAAEGTQQHCEHNNNRNTKLLVRTLLLPVSVLFLTSVVASLLMLTNSEASFLLLCIQIASNYVLSIIKITIFFLSTTVCHGCGGPQVTSLANELFCCWSQRGQYTMSIAGYRGLMSHKRESFSDESFKFWWSSRDGTTTYVCTGHSRIYPGQPDPHPTGIFVLLLFSVTFCL